ncbi:hypothetical protein ACFC09_37865 [Streptomyces sp. NPDC056161]|uniref:hypothetical protein n=1 Tax=Streptomyces sp. NPDC056161 TaxID=3345732 RepID=UPI0035DC9D25
MNGWILASTVVLGLGAGAVLWGVCTGPLRRRVVTHNLSTSVVRLTCSCSPRATSVPRTSISLSYSPCWARSALFFARLLANDLGDDPPRAAAVTWGAAGFGAAVVLVLCAGTEPSRAMVEFMAIGALLVCGNVIASRALSGDFRVVRRD